jgi:glucosamine-phosphate N-acetyltransferase
MGYLIRNLLKTDYSPQLFQLLGQLTDCPIITKEQYDTFLDSLGPLHQVVCVVTEKDQIAGMGTIFIEHKIIHGLGKVAHIEDIVTDSKYRGQGLGAQIINHLVQQAKIAGCYKVILDCGEHNIGFYSKCEFEQKGVQMAKYF